MISWHSLLAILAMAGVTYSTRLAGYVLLRKRTLSPRMQAVLQNVPGCVLISVIAPAFVSDQPADLIALGVTVLAACRWSILPTVITGIVAAGVLRHLF